MASITGISSVQTSEEKQSNIAQQFGNRQASIKDGKVFHTHQKCSIIYSRLYERPGILELSNLAADLRRCIKSCQEIKDKMDLTEGNGDPKIKAAVIQALACDESVLFVLNEWTKREIKVGFPMPSYNRHGSNGSD